jgi:hypothetical protein
MRVKSLLVVVVVVLHLVLPGCECADGADVFGMQLVVTHKINGAVWPVNADGISCKVVSPTTNCNTSCKGGAARRATAISAARTVAADKGIDLITFDTGGFFFGYAFSL